MTKQYKPRIRKPPLLGYVEGKVRTTMFRGEPLFVARDLELCLGYGNASNAIREYCKGQRVYQTFRNGKHFRPLRIISRGEFSRLIARCQSPIAQEFSDYLFHVVFSIQLKPFPPPFETIEGRIAWSPPFVGNR